MSETWKRLWAAEGCAEPAVAVVLTTRERHWQEKVQFSRIAAEILAARDNEKPRPLVMASGDNLADALGSIGAPVEAVQILVISPYAADRGRLAAEAKARWPFAMGAFEAEKVGGGAYIVVDLRPCRVQDPDHVHTPGCMEFPRAARATCASA